MKFIEIQGGWKQPVSNEENIIVEMVRGYGKPLPKSNLDIRQKELARMLVSRGLLTRLVIENKIYFIVNDLQDLWEG